MDTIQMLYLKEMAFANEYINDDDYVGWSPKQMLFYTILEELLNLLELNDHHYTQT